LLIIYPLASKTHSEEYYNRILSRYKKVLSTFDNVEVFSIITSLHEVENIQPEEHDVPILLFLTGGTSKLGIELARKYKKPVIVIAHGEHNSLPSALSCKGKCEILGLPCITLYSNVPEEIVYEFTKIHRAYSGYSYIKSLRILLIDSKEKTKDAQQFENIIKGSIVIPIPPEVLDEKASSINDADIEKQVKLLIEAKKITGIHEHYRHVKNALKYYLAFKELIAENKANALTLDCFNFITRRRITPCLPLALLNSEGIPAACEEDYHSLILLALSMKLAGKPGWIGNPTAIDSDLMVFAHCTIALVLSKSIELLPHFETGLPIAVSGNVPSQECILARITYDYKELLLYPCKIVKSGLLSNNRCRTQIHLRFSNISPREFIGKAKGNHHVLIADSKVLELLKYTGTLLGLRTRII